MTYGMTFSEALGEHDAILEQDGLTLYVDAVALGFLNGVEIDFVQQGVGASFVFKNAFAATGGSGACGGCGGAASGGWPRDYLPKYKSVIPAQAGIQNLVNVTGSRPDDHSALTLNLKNKHLRLLLLAPTAVTALPPYLSAAQSPGVDVLIASSSKHALVSAVAEDLLAAP